MRPSWPKIRAKAVQALSDHVVFVVARHGVPRFFEPRDQPVDVFQFGVAAQVGEVAAEDHDVARRGVDFVHRDAEQANPARCRASRGCRSGRRRGACRRELGPECRRRPQRAEAQQDFGVFHWACAAVGSVRNSAEKAIDSVAKTGRAGFLDFRRHPDRRFYARPHGANFLPARTGDRRTDDKLP